MAQWGSWAAACVRCGRNHPGEFRDGQTCGFKCGKAGHFMKKCPKNSQCSWKTGNRAQSLLVAPLDRAAPGGASSSTGEGPNCFYVITSHQEQENTPDVVTFMIKVFTFDFYALLDTWACLSSVTLYVLNKFEILPEKLCYPFYVSTPVGESILDERVYRDWPISINNKNTMADLVEFDMVYYDVILMPSCMLCINRV